MCKVSCITKYIDLFLVHFEYRLVSEMYSVSNSVTVYKIKSELYIIKYIDFFLSHLVSVMSVEMN